MGNVVTIGTSRSNNSDSIDPFEDMLDHDHMDHSTPHFSATKVLILGCGDTGKSTFFKQATALSQSKAFPKDIREKHKDIISANIVSGVIQLAEHVKRSHVPVTHDSDLVEYFADLDETQFVNIKQIWNTPGFVNDVISAWEHDAIQTMFQNKHKLTGNFCGEALQHFMNKIHEIKHPEYVPTLQDIMFTHVKTSGLLEYEIVLDGAKISLIDTGGQRSERKKWFHLYEGTTCVVFTVSLIEYATNCYEDEETNRMLESLRCFEQIVNLPNFEKVPFVLAFTKVDALSHVSQRKRFKSVFPKFKGQENNFTDIATFLKDLFVQQYKGSEECKILPMIVSTMDEEMMKKALRAMVDVALSGSARGHHFNADQYSFEWTTPNMFTKEKVKHSWFCDIIVETTRKSSSSIDRGDYSPAMIKHEKFFIYIDKDTHTEFDPPTDVPDGEVDTIDMEPSPYRSAAEDVGTDALRSNSPRTPSSPIMFGEHKKKSREEVERLVALMHKQKNK